MEGGTGLNESEIGAGSDAGAAGGGGGTGGTSDPAGEAGWRGADAGVEEAAGVAGAGCFRPKNLRRKSMGRSVVRAERVRGKAG